MLLQYQYQEPERNDVEFVTPETLERAPSSVKAVSRYNFPMPKFVIEREIPGLGKMSPAELQAAAQRSLATLKELGPNIQWLQSFVTDDRLYCVYLAPDEDLIKQHAARAGFPANRISLVRNLIDPTTAE